MSGSAAGEEPLHKRARQEDDVPPPPADRYKRATGRRFMAPAACRLKNCREHGESEEPFFFMQLADTQLGLEGSFNRSVVGWDKELEFMRIAAAEINRLRPAFVIVCGDLVNEWPIEEVGRKADPELRRRQVADYKEAFSLIDEDIPLVCLCGNHDIGDRPNAASIRSYTDHFGDDYFSFWCNGVKMIVVNSQLWKDDTDAKDIREAMDRWLEEELKDATPEVHRTLLFSHVPPFLFKADEGDEYFNLENTFRQDLLAKLSKKGVVGWFCGHYHRNAGGTYRDADGRELEVVVTGAVGTMITDRPGGNPLGKSGIGGAKIGEDDSGVRIVKVLKDRVQHQWKTINELKAMPVSEAEAEL